MGWFTEQLEQRRKKDNENFEQAIDSIADAILGERIVSAFSKNEIVHSAIEEVLKYYHCPLPKDELPSSLKTVEEKIEYRMRPHGISFRSVSLDNGWYHHAVGIMIGTLKSDGSAVALIPGKFAGYFFVDIATGKKLRLNKKTAVLLDNEAVCFYQPLPLRAITIKDLIVFMVQQLNMSDAVMHFGMLLFSALVGLLSPLFTKWLFGVVLASKSLSVLAALANFMFCYSVCSALISAFQELVSIRITTKINIAIQAAVMNRMLNLPVKFYREYSSGELAQRSDYIQSLCSSIMSMVTTVGTSTVFSVVYVAQMFTYAPELVIPALITILATVAINMISVLVQIKITKEIMLRSTKTVGLTYAAITGIQKVKLAGAEKRMFSRWARLYASEASLLYNPPLFVKINGTITMTISFIGTLAIYFISVKSLLSVSEYYAFNTAYSMIMSAFGMLTSVVSSIANIRPTLDMVEPILKAEPELAGNKKEIHSLGGGIELSDVSFAYDQSSGDVIHNLSLKINPGEYIAIVGATGCGKSTLIRLLLGFEKPQKGTIFYDHEDMACLDLKSLRKLIGTVMQDGKLFSGDIYSNIVISAPQLTLDDAWAAAETASAADDIRKMPMGMFTLVSDEQGSLSGGQKQRIIIARAIAPKPKILIFDEATSALDNITQKNVSDAIDSLGCTRIVVAHRLSTIRHADRIIYIDKGSIAEEGSYDELIAKNGLFAALVERQRLDI